MFNLICICFFSSPLQLPQSGKVCRGIFIAKLSNERRKKRRRRAKKKFSSKGISWVFRVYFQALSQVKRDAAGRLSGCQSNCCLMWHSWGREACGCFSWPLCDEKARNKRRNFVFIVADPQTIIYCDCQWDGSRKRQTIVRAGGVGRFLPVV